MSERESSAPSDPRRELVERVRASVSIVDLVGEFVLLRKSGQNHWGLCPFHPERSPSFAVREKTQLFHCFGCKKGGDAFSFLQELHGIGFREALAEVASRGGVALPESAGGGAGDPAAREAEIRRRQRTDDSHKLNKLALAFFGAELAKDARARGYLLSRGLGEEAIREFRLGAAPSGWENLAHFLATRKAPLELAAEIGLVRPSQRAGSPGSTGYFDLFRERAIFPIIDIRGKVAGFGGRLVPSGGDPADSPKYLNSPASPIFEKEKELFGIFQAQKHIREAGECIVVEGYVDAVAMHLSGFRNTVAVCGTTLSQHHLRTLRRLAPSLTILFDGDRAGEAATEASMITGLRCGWVLRSASLPQGMDPDELLFSEGKPSEAGRARMKELLSGARPILDARIEAEITRSLANGPEGRSQALKKACGWLAELQGDEVGREIRIESLASKLGVAPALARKAMGLPPGNAEPRATAGRHTHALAHASAQGPAQEQPPVRRPDGRTGAVPRAEWALITAILSRSGQAASALAWISGHLPPGRSLAELFSHEKTVALANWLTAVPGRIELLREDSRTTSDLPVNPNLREFFAEALFAADAEFPEGTVRAAAARLCHSLWARKLPEIRREILAAEAQGDGSKQAEFMKEFLDVQRKLKELSRFYDERDASPRQA